MPPDPHPEGRAPHHDDTRRRQATKRERSHSEPRPADTFSSSNRSPVPASQYPVSIDLTGDTDENLCKHTQSQEPPSNHSSKRPKLSHEGDILEAATEETATGENVQTTEPSSLQLRAEVDVRNADDGLPAKKDERSTKAERHTSDTAQHELEAAKSSLRASDDELESKVQLLTDELQSLTSKHHDLDGKQREWQAQNERLQAQVAQQEVELRAKNDELDTELQQKERFRREGVSVREKLDGANQEIKTLREELELSQYLRLQAEADLMNAKEQAKYTQQSLKEAEKTRNATELVNERWGVKSKEWKDTKKELSKKLTTIRRDLKNTQAEHEELKSALTAKNEELQAEYDAHLQECNECKGELLQQIRDLQGLSKIYNFKVSDEELTEQWGDLKHKICQMVDRYARPVTGLNEQDLSPDWTEFSSQAAVLLSSPLLYTFAFEAYLWRWLGRIVFNPRSTIWAGILGKSLSVLSANASRLLGGVDDELTPEYHSWRSTSSNLVSRLNQRAYNHESYRQDVGALVDDLAKLLGFDEASQEGAHADATAILNCARSFDTTRRKLKAEIVLFDCCLHASGNFVLYDGHADFRCMRDRSPHASAEAANQNSTVDLIISPGVIRVGNSDGIDYNISTCLVKMDVLCDITRASPQQPPFQPRPSPRAQLVAQQQAVPCPSHEEHGGGGHVLAAEGDAETEEDARESNHNVSPPPLQVSRASPPVAVGACLDGSGGIGGISTGPATRPSRSSAVAARAAIARGNDEPDELAGAPPSDADGDRGPKPSSARRRRARRGEDEAYVPPAPARDD